MICFNSDPRCKSLGQVKFTFTHSGVQCSNYDCPVPRRFPWYIIIIVSGVVAIGAVVSGAYYVRIKSN